MIAEIYARAKGILIERQADLKRVAAELMRKETLYHGDLDRLLSQPQPAAASPGCA
jgi:ATP-dependent Zn protease